MPLGVFESRPTVVSLEIGIGAVLQEFLRAAKGSGVEYYVILFRIIDSDPFSGQQHGLIVLSFDVALSPLSFRTIRRRLTAQSNASKYLYGFPDGDGDCNCTTWIERLGLPLLTGRMDEFTAVAGVAGQVRRRFGVCI